MRNLRHPVWCPRARRCHTMEKAYFLQHQSRELETGEQVEYPIWRQLYRMENGHVAELINDTEYPVNSLF